MTAHWQDPRRRCLKVAEWPLVDQAMWANVTHRASPFDNPGRGSHWRDTTKLKYRKGYGRWLAYLADNDLLGKDQDPVARVSRQVVSAYVAELGTQVSPVTVTGRIADLCSIMLAAAPDRDWQWIRDLRRRLEIRSRGTERSKTERVISTARLVDWGLDRMDQALTDADLKCRYRSVHYRDGLMVALLALCPLRLKNFTTIEIGRHLVNTGSRYVLFFEGHETKTGIPEDADIPPQLAGHLVTYLDEIRPRLLGEKSSNRLWISQMGTAMTEISVHHRITEITDRAFGVVINPHLFRDCAATTYALNDPQGAFAAAALLNHRSHRTTEKHYIQGRTLEASIRYGDIIDEVRASLGIVWPDKLV